MSGAEDHRWSWSYFDKQNKILSNGIHLWCIVYFILTFFAKDSVFFLNLLQQLATDAALVRFQHLHSNSLRSFQHQSSQQKTFACLVYTILIFAGSHHCSGFFSVYFCFCFLGDYKEKQFLTKCANHSILIDTYCFYILFYYSYIQNDVKLFFLTKFSKQHTCNNNVKHVFGRFL